MISHKLFAWCFFVCVGWGFSKNPLVNYHYLADPTVAVVGDSIFYIIADTDYDNDDDYNMKGAYLLSSKDMKNWTDHGEIFRVPENVGWASGVWAPAAVWHNEKMYLYFPNMASGVGVVVSENPAGPYRDPLGDRLINPSLGHCDGIAWCFDPGVFVDDDGQGYLIWGGGSNDQRPYGDNFSAVKLNADMISWSGSPIQMKGMTRSFEAPYINKFNGKYYLSYNAEGQTIDYAMSENPLGPWEYKGTVLANPNINGQNINAYNNNHHGFGIFKGKWYAAYHERRIALAENNVDPAYHRSVSIDRLEFNEDGTINPLVFTKEGPAQIQNFNPYQEVLAATSSDHRGVTTKSYRSASQPVTNLLIPKPQSSGESWLQISQVNFGSLGASEFVFEASSVASGNQIVVKAGSVDGTILGECSVQTTGDWNDYKTNRCRVAGLKGVVPELYLVFTGADSTVGLKKWTFVEGEPKERGAFLGVPSTIPGKIEFENYDEGGNGQTYFDDSWGSETGVDFRVSEDVDVEICEDEGGGYNIGWATSGEWLEYTVNVNHSGRYRLKIRIACALEGRTLNLSMGENLLLENLAIPNTGGWQSWETLVVDEVFLDEGSRVLRVEIGDSNYVNLNFIEFEFLEETTAREQIFAENSSIELEGEWVRMKGFSPGTEFHLFTIHGALLLKSKKSSLPLAEFQRGIYLLRTFDGITQKYGHTKKVQLF